MSESVSAAAGATVVDMLPPENLSKMEAIGLRLSAARRALQKSQREICDALDVATNKWNQWEKGRHLPDQLVMIEFADRYGISLDWVYRGRADHLPSDRVDRIVTIYRGLLAERGKAA